MPSSEVLTISSTSSALSTCPAFVHGPDGLPVECGEPVSLIASRSIVGDDYGSWATVTVYLACGHTVDEIENSLRHADEI